MNNLSQVPHNKSCKDVKNPNSSVSLVGPQHVLQTNSRKMVIDEPR